MESLKKDNWFVSPIFIGNWNNEEQNEIMLKEIVRLKKTVQSSNRSSINGWQSVKNLYEFEFVEPFLNFIKVPVVQALIDLKLDLTKDNLVINQMWANVNPKNSYNKSHQHPDSFLSGVYYLQTPINCGKIYFEDPRNSWCLLQPSYVELDEFSSTEVSYEPKPGMFILFPSYLSHRVDINNSKEDRISISFNISV